MGGMGGGSSIAGVLSAFGGAASGISEIPEIFRIAASACTGPGHYIFQLYEWLCIQVERVPFHSIVAGRPEMWKIGVFYVALWIRYVWSVGEARDNLERKGIFLFPKEWNAPGKNSVFIAVAVVFLVVQPVHGFQSWFLDVGQGGGPGYIFQPSFGYIIGFAVAAYVNGKIANAKTHPSYRRLLGANFLGLFIVYAFGMIYYYVISNFYLNSPIGVGALFLYCFVLAVPGDIVLCIVAAIIGKRMIPLIQGGKLG